ncbi:Delta-1-pyrroline-5-carboxylate dehydrogenase, mitochondrial [Cytospora mali]|uniref:Multifunctional fusion protein n=1 Tax=Cytospora mali TaxID=578113 RepID=A0A194VAT8_CYTMA|nr:Delta-1-pyrroline-5-carboxylate dehydrogenase, mitochondrial [Valsa mali var. pyri (nom. inval.)]
MLPRILRGTPACSRQYGRAMSRSVIQIQKARMSVMNVPTFKNEPPKTYAKGSPERAELTEAIKDLNSRIPVNIPLTAGGVAINSDFSAKQENPSKHSESVAKYALATPQDVDICIDAALKAKPAWEALPFEDRAAVFLRACELVAGKYRSEIVAATMLGQGKNIWQAEIDAASETCDFFRKYIEQCRHLYAEQPELHDPGSWNKLEYRPLEGFVYAIAPFNFTALGATLVGPAALLGNVVVWKPSPSALHASWLLYQILLEAGLPKDVIQFVTGDAELITDAVLARSEFSAMSYIGSTAVFKELLGKIGDATQKGTFRSYPRVVGETGGKNFHIIHSSADVKSAAFNTVRAAFEYQGQKCSACSRVYVAESVWPEFRKHVVEQTEALKVGNPEDYSNFINPVIHERSFDKLNSVIENAKSDPELELIVGGQASKAEGYYVHPTVYKTNNPRHELMSRELFGPIFAVYVYPDAEWDSVPKLVDSTSTYALTGSVFARDPMAARHAQNGLKHSAGMLYMNTKCTGSVVGQQPFGGSRDSGTNDKTGTMAHLSRFTSVRTIKEEFAPLTEVTYLSNEV